jgi:RHS repeat-associated protein
LVVICLSNNIQASLPGVPDNRNYIITYAPHDPRDVINPAVNPHLLGATIQYFDGLGRPIQAIAYKQAPDQGNIVTFNEYDELGRQPREFLPFHQAAGTNAAYISSPRTAQVSSYSSIHVWDQNHAFSLTDFEKSPLNRVSSIMGPGRMWSDSIRKVNFQYGTNSNNEVRKLKINSNGTLSPDGYYASGTLYMTQKTDEDDKVTIEWKDLNGRVVKTKMGGGNIWAITYYAYDDFGLLRWVLPPKAVQGNHFNLTPETGIGKALCYYYKYDGRKRLIEKHIPGADKIINIYNSRDQLVLNQNGNQRAKSTKEWTAHHYDDLGRLMYSAILSTNDSESFLRAQAGANLNYVNTRITDSNKYIENWYDTPPSDSKIPWNASHYQNMDGQTGWTNYPSQPSTLTRGMLTASRIREFNETSYAAWIRSIYFYDDKGRMIQSRENMWGSQDYNLTLNLYNWAGDLLRDQVTFYPFSWTTAGAITLESEYTYDHTGRLKADKKRYLKNGTEVASFEPTTAYDKLGRVSSVVYSSGSSGLLGTNYLYNIRSWLRRIDHFQYSEYNTLFYIDIKYQDSGNTYSGNISSVSYKKNVGSIRTYNYEYDKLNRLITATSTGDRYNTNYTYDVNGNIMTLNRNGLISGTNFGSIDALHYGYLNGGNSNQLMHVNNSVANLGPDSFLDNGSTSTTNPEFTYDKIGNMVFDGNKSMDINYNFLNLPARVTRYQGTPNQQAIHYHYTATGRKMRERSVVNGSTTTRFYAGPFVFINNPYTDPAWINTPYGRFVQHNGQWTTEFYLKDHLGNTCLAMLKTSSNNHVISQENHYYPFGMRISSLSSEPVSMGNRKNRYIYNGKEFNEEFGLNWYDYGARFYDPQIARWHSVDPLAERAYSWTPYRYGFNNPISYIDPDGMFETEELAREHKRQAGISGRVRRQNDGTYAIHHKGTSGGVRTFNDSEFGVTTAYVFKAPEPKFSQGGGIPWFGEGGGETQTTAKHTDPFMDSSPFTSFQPGRRVPQPLGILIANIADRLAKIFSNVNQTESNTGTANSNESAVNPPDDTNAQGQSDPSLSGDITRRKYPTHYHVIDPITGRTYGILVGSRKDSIEKRSHSSSFRPNPEMEIWYKKDSNNTP